jgi:hypothetical protein
MENKFDAYIDSNIFGVGVSNASNTLAGRSWHTGSSCNQIYRELGLVLYASAAMANHSCEPNCGWSTDCALRALDDGDGGSESSGDGLLRGLLPTQEIRTTRATVKGGELLINYVMLNQNGMKVGGKKRRRQLRNAFFFDCLCEVSS